MDGDTAGGIAIVGVLLIALALAALGATGLVIFIVCLAWAGACTMLA